MGSDIGPQQWVQNNAPPRSPTRHSACHPPKYSSDLNVDLLGIIVAISLTSHLFILPVTASTVSFFLVTVVRANQMQINVSARTVHHSDVQLTTTTNIAEPSIPAEFLSLRRKFRRINTHLTFLASFSRHTLPSLSHLQTLDPNITACDLQMILLLMPTGVTFGYVDENEIMLGEKVKFSWARGYELQLAVDAAYAPVEPARPVLLFEFCDSKTQTVGAVARAGRMRGVRKEERGPFSSAQLAVTPLPQLQLQATVRARNARFDSAVAAWPGSYADLCARAQATLPVAPTLADPVEESQKSETTNGRLSESNKNGNIDPTLPESPVSCDAMVAALEKAPLFRNQHYVSAPLTAARNASFAPAPADLHPHALAALRKRGIDPAALYTHQARALDAVLGGTHTIISTATSLGKSLVYQLPIISRILHDADMGWNTHSRTATALFVFPTKALAQDQKRHLLELVAQLPPGARKISVDTYDGDTASGHRQHVRRFADIVFTNPDAIHAAILPNALEGENRGWPNFLTNLRYVVVDELHVYRGTFGVNVSFVMARLNRMLAHMGARPVYVLCSATINNPEAHFRAVCALTATDEVVHVAEDGSAAKEKVLVVWEPPVLMNKRGELPSNWSKGYKPQTLLRPMHQSRLPPNVDPSSNAEANLGVESNLDLTSQQQGLGSDLPSPASLFLPRESILSETAKILVHLLTSFPNIKIIVFCPIRQMCELVIKEVRALIKDNRNTQWNALHEHDVMAYRGGYSKSDRRAIEQKMFRGELRAIVATNALELGIDIADLDVVISCGFPQLKLNLHQQFGRGGRGSSSNGSMAILVCGANPVDRYYLNHPQELCDMSSYEDLCIEGILDSSLNEMLKTMHLQCAAFELPIDLERDLRWFSRNSPDEFVRLCKENLHPDNRGAYRTDPRYLPWPAEKVSLRAIEETAYAVVDITNNRNVVIEEIEELRTSFTLYEGGIFLHQGYPYLVKEFNPDEKYAKVQRVDVTWLTQQRDFSDVDPVQIELVKQLFPPSVTTPTDIPVFYGPVETTIIVFGYFKVSRKQEILEAVDVKNPPVVIRSKGFWVDIPRGVLGAIEDKRLNAAGGIHAAQHAIMNTLPIFIAGGATTDPNVRFNSSLGDAELSTECKAPEKEFAQRQSKRKRPARLIFYDSKGGPQGTGMSAKTFELIDQIIYTTYRCIVECDCDWGCPRCVTGSFCKENMLVMSKPAAIIILGSLLGYSLEEMKSKVPDGPEPNMPPVNVETITETGRGVKFAPDVQIVAVRKAKPLVKQEEE